MILVVDNDATDRETIGKALEHLGFTVASCPSGDSAMRIVEAHGADLAGLVTMIALPGLANGWDVAGAFRARNAQAPIVYVFQEIFDEPCLTRTNLGVRKPYNAAHLAQSVKQLHLRARELSV